MKKIALLGGSRFIGFHLLWALYRQGHEITVFNRSMTKPPAPFPDGVTFIKGDRNHPEDLRRLFCKRFDVVFDINGWRPDQVEPIVRNYRSNIGQYIFLSTTNVYQSSPANPLNEESPRIFTGKTSGGNKALTEELLLKVSRENNFPVTIFRPQGVIGPYDPCSMGLIFYRLIHSLPIFVLSETNKSINYLYVHDLVEAFILAMNNPSAYGLVYVVAGDDITRPREFIDLCGKICSKSPILNFIDNPLNHENIKNVKKKRYVDFCHPWPKHDQVCDNRKIKRELGVHFTDLETTLRETFSWLLEKPAYLDYFYLPGEQYILTDRPIPLLVKLHWELTDVLEGLMKGIKDTMKRVQLFKRGYCYFKGIAQA